MQQQQPQPPAKADVFDRAIGALVGRPDVFSVKASTVMAIDPLVGNARTFIVRTYREREKGDTIFIQGIDAESSFRLALPPKVADAIARQRGALTDSARSKAAQAIADDRKARGVRPAFLKGRATAAPVDATASDAATPTQTPAASSRRRKRGRR